MYFLLQLRLKKLCSLYSSVLFLNFCLLYTLRIYIRSMNYLWMTHRRLVQSFFSTNVQEKKKRHAIKPVVCLADSLVECLVDSLVVCQVDSRAVCREDFQVSQPIKFRTIILWIRHSSFWKTLYTTPRELQNYKNLFLAFFGDFSDLVFNVVSDRIIFWS